MLRSLSMHNFVHFTKPQRLIFEPGANFIIGANSTGKTAIFELIRRCLSNDISTTTTSVPNRKELAYTVCGFEIPPDHTYGCDVDETIFEKVPSKIVTGLFVRTKYTGNDANDNDVHFYKFVCSNIGEDDWQIGMQEYKGSCGCNSDELERVSSCTYIYRKGHVVVKILEKVFSKKDIDIHIDIKKLFSCIGTDERKLDGKRIDGKRIDDTFAWLTQSFVSVFPMRSPGPLQWSRSKLVDPQQRENNYRNASKRAEILMDLLDEGNRDRIDWDIEKKYHSHLVHPYIFKKGRVRETKMEESSGEENNKKEQDSITKEAFEIRVYNADDSNEKELKPIPLLKTPDGIVEAKQLSLLLSEKTTFTIQIEEPDRGMHPQMINRLRDWVLKKIRNKTVLIISHHPAILDHTTLDRVHVCSKTFDGGQLSHVVSKFPNQIQYKKYGMVDEMKCLLFSERVLFVEGYTDKIILEAVFDILVNHHEIYEDNVRELPDKGFLQQEDFKGYVSSLQIVELREGWPSGKSKMEFCRKINKESLVLYDFDVVRRLLDAVCMGTIASGNTEDLTTFEDIPSRGKGGLNLGMNIIKDCSESEDKMESDNVSVEKVNISAKIAESIDNVVISVDYNDGFKSKKQKITPFASKDWEKQVMNKTEHYCGEMAGILEEPSVMDSFKNPKVPIEIAGDNIGVKFKKTYDNVESFRKDQNEVKKFENACEKRNVFVWIEGSIEDVVNKADTEDEFKKKYDIPTGKFRGWKKHLIEKDDKFCVELAIILIKNSSEIHRFLRFLHENMKRAELKYSNQDSNKRKRKDDNVPKSRKRIASNEYTFSETDQSGKGGSQPHTGLSPGVSKMNLKMYPSFDKHI